jgi:lipopolysaccharide export system protein LptA
MKSNCRSNTPAIIAVLLITFLAGNAKADVFTWSAKRQWSQLSEGRELTVLSGGAVITSDATTIIADEIELWGTDFRYSMARGTVTATDIERGIILKSDTLFYDREEEIIRVDGFIDMQDLKNDVVVRGGFFEYFGKDEIAFIQIGVRILKVDEDSELACRSEFARYLRDDEILELSGMPKVTRNNDIYSAARITINLDTDEILLDRDVSGTLITETEEETPEAGANGPAEAEQDAGDRRDTEENSDGQPPKEEDNTGADEISDDDRPPEEAGSEPAATDANGQQSIEEPPSPAENGE